MPAIPAAAARVAPIPPPLYAWSAPLPATLGARQGSELLRMVTLPVDPSWPSPPWATPTRGLLPARQPHDEPGAGRSRSDLHVAGGRPGQAPGQR
jgi:hypothetical protein